MSEVRHSSKDERPWKAHDPVLRVHRSELIRRDSYGVHGSDFYVCRICDKESGAGVLNKGIQHESDCPLGRYEARAAKRGRS